MTVIDRAAAIPPGGLAAYAAETERFLRVCGADSTLAADLCQEALLLAVRKNVLCPTAAEARAWLRRTTRFLLLEEARRQRRHATSVDPTWIDGVEHHFASLPDGDEWTDAVRACTEQVGDRARRALELVYRDRCTYAEAAQRLGMRANGIKSLLRRVRHQLRICIERRLP